jgi:hypothetical protein
LIFKRSGCCCPAMVRCLADPTDVMREAVAPLLARGDLQP